MSNIMYMIYKFRKSEDINDITVLFLTSNFSKAKNYLHKNNNDNHLYIYRINMFNVLDNSDKLISSER